MQTCCSLKTAQKGQAVPGAGGEPARHGAAVLEHTLQRRRPLRVEAHMEREPAARRARRACLQAAHKAAMWVEGRRAAEQTG